MTSPEQLEQFVRFSLETLRERNGHHAFEAICLGLSRRRIASNLLPATGPVAAGGDQGRDAESHWTNLPNESRSGSVFARLATTDSVVLACTLQAGDVPGKIKKDLSAICAGEPVDRVVYFTIAPVAVAKRHELQQHVRKVHGVALDVWDALAIAAALAEADLFHLAQQYLGVPADMAPAPAEPDCLPAWYRIHRGLWRSRTLFRGTFEEFMALREGLRYATIHAEAQADLADWLGHARALLAAATEADVVRGAQYEIAVGTLFGTDTLRPADALVRAFFETLPRGCADRALLEDAVVLGQYTLGAIAWGCTGIEGEELAGWLADLLASVCLLLEGREAHPNTRAELLALSARLRLSPAATRLPSTMPADLDAGMADLVELCALLPKAPLFPVDRLASLFDAIAPDLSGHPRYCAVRDALDEATGRVAGRAAKAARAKMRGMAMLSANRLLEALHEFHEAKANWWHGNTRTGVAFAMLALSEIYGCLRLPLAAKHYAVQAYVVADHAELNAARGLVFAARSCYQAGSWLTATYIAREALAGYFVFGQEPWTSERYPEVRALLQDLAWMVRVARRLRPRLATAMRTLLADVGADALISRTIDRLDESDWTETGIACDSDRCGLGRPFSDLGATRTYAWQALGMTWTVTAANNRHAILAAERFGAAAQIVLAELAGHDAGLVPARVEVEIRPDAAGRPPLAAKAELLPGDDAARWLVHLSRVDQLDAVALHRELFEVLVQILYISSRLPSDRFVATVQGVIHRGLMHKLVIGRPYDEAADLLPEEQYTQAAGATDGPVGTGVPLEPVASIELDQRW